MKLFVNVLLIIALYYCIPQGPEYNCVPIDPDRIQRFSSSQSDCVTNDCTFKSLTKEPYKCDKVKNKWECKPFDKGAILMEPQHDCPSGSPNWNFTPTVIDFMGKEVK